MLFRDPDEAQHNINTIIVTSPSIASMTSPKSSSNDHNDTDNDGRAKQPAPTSPISVNERAKISIPDAFLNEQESSAGSQATRFSTPIADRFARDGPVTIQLREKPGDSR